VSSGKTYIQVIRWLDYIYSDEVPSGCLLMMTGKTSEALYDNIIREMIKLDDTGDIRHVRNPSRIFIGSKNIEIACVGANNHESRERIQGKTVYGWLADEIVQHPKSFVLMAQSRCRGGGEIRPKFWTCNPDSPSHFIKTNYIDNLKLDVKNWNFVFEDNPFLTSGYIEELNNSYLGIYNDRFIKGLWVLAEGVIYDKFRKDIHVVKDYNPNAVDEYILGIDWGYAKDHPLAILLIAVCGADYIVVDEVYEEGQLIDKTLIDKLRNRGWYKLPIYKPDKELTFIQPSKTETIPNWAYADTARPDLIKQFYQFSGIRTVGAIKDVDDGIQAVHRKLVVKGDGRPNLFVLEKCRNTIKEFELYSWDQKANENGKGVPKKWDDHAMDSLRYAIFTRERARVRRIKI